MDRPNIARVPLLLVALFVVVPLVELFLIIQVGQVIGAWWTIAILLADSILGSLILRSQGRAAWRRFNAVMGEGRVPHREILDGVMIILGGALLLTPGFLTDVFGLLLLAPPSRAAIRRVLVRLLSHRVVYGIGGPAGAVAYGGARRMWRRRGADGSEERPPPGRGGVDPREGREGGGPDIEGTARDGSSPHLRR